MLFRKFLLGRMNSALQHVVWEAEGLVAYLNPKPWTPGCVILEHRAHRKPGGSVFHLEKTEFLSWMVGARTVAELLCDRLAVQRCALVSRPQRDRSPQIGIIPLHGLDKEWRPHLAGEEEYNASDPGYCTSKSAPRWSESRLMEIQARIRAKAASPDAPPSFAFHGEDPSHPGLFSRIVRGEEQQWRVWEDDGHVAFLTPFPNCTGLTVVVPRRPLTSNIFKLDREDYEGLALASREVSELLEKGLGAWGTGLIFEGFEIDYAHAKLMPLLPPSPLPNKGETGRPPEFHPIYPGYVTSEDGPEADLEDLKKLQTKITGSCFTVETGVTDL